MHISKLPTEIYCNQLLKYLTVADCWAISRTCKEIYGYMNKKIFGLFKEHFNFNGTKRSEHMSVIRYCLGIISPYNYAFTGSIVWSTLLGEYWFDQDIDLFVEGSYLRMHELRRGGNLSYKGTFYEVIVLPGVPATFYGDCLRIRDIPNWNRIADIVWCKDNSIKSTLDQFDITGCSCYFDDKVLFIPNPSDTLFKRSFVKKQPGISDEIFQSRSSKYRERGITLLYQ